MALHQELMARLDPRHTLENERGNLIMALCFSLIVLSATIFAVAASSQRTVHMQTSMLTTESNLTNFESTLVAYVQNPVTWNQMLASSKNGNLKSCFTDPTFNCPNTPMPLILLNNDGSVFYDSSQTAVGVNRYGNICDTYGLPQPGECLYSFKLTWAPQCNPLTANCQASPVLVTITLTIPGASSTKIQINPNRFATNVTVN